MMLSTLGAMNKPKGVVPHNDDSDGAYVHTEQYQLDSSLRLKSRCVSQAHGAAHMRASGSEGYDTFQQGDVRTVEFVDHPLFLAILYQPELLALDRLVRPLVQAFVKEAVKYGGARTWSSVEFWTDLPYIPPDERG